MASLNLMQWREQSLWRRHRGLHSFGFMIILVLTCAAAQWIVSFTEPLNQLKLQIAEQQQALEQRKKQQRRWLAYQQKHKAQRAFIRRKKAERLTLNAFYALLDKTDRNLKQRELFISRSQFRLSAGYRQIQDVNGLYLWLERQLVEPGLKQQLLPQQRVLFRYTNKTNETERRG